MTTPHEDQVTLGSAAGIVCWTPTKAGIPDTYRLRFVPLPVDRRCSSHGAVLLAGSAASSGVAGD